MRFLSQNQIVLDAVEIYISYTRDDLKFLVYPYRTQQRQTTHIDTGVQVYSLGFPPGVWSKHSGLGTPVP